MTTGTNPIVLVFKQILEGDVRKVDARSADANTGGGARDFRFPHEAFAPAMNKMFPTPGHTTRNGGQVQLGSIEWANPNGTTQRTNVEYWPPTDKRPTEGRIAQVSNVPPLADYPHHDFTFDQLFLLLILDSSGVFVARYASLSSIVASWGPEVAVPVERALMACRADRAAQGWVDFITGKEYIHS